MQRLWNTWNYIWFYLPGFSSQDKTLNQDEENCSKCLNRKLVPHKWRDLFSIPDRPLSTSCPLPLTNNTGVEISVKTWWPVPSGQTVSRDMPWTPAPISSIQLRNWGLEAEGYSDCFKVFLGVPSLWESPCDTHTPGPLESSLPWKSISCRAERLCSSVFLPWEASITAAHRLAAAISEERGCDGRLYFYLP